MEMAGQVNMICDGSDSANVDVRTPVMSRLCLVCVNAFLRVTALEEVSSDVACICARCQATSVTRHITSRRMSRVSYDTIITASHTSRCTSRE